MNSSTKRLPKTTDNIQHFVLWVVVTAWMWALGPAIWVIVGEGGSSIGVYIETGLFLFGGIFIGLGQWLIFRHLGISGWWIAVTALGWTLGWFESIALIFLLGGGDFGMLGPIWLAIRLPIVGIIPGVTLGGLQSFTLRDDMRIRWILATSIGWAIGLPLSFVLSNLLPSLGNWGQAGFGTCISVGVATGIVLLQWKAHPPA